MEPIGISRNLTLEAYELDETPGEQILALVSHRPGQDRTVIYVELREVRRLVGALTEAAVVLVRGNGGGGG